MAQQPGRHGVGRLAGILIDDVLGHRALEACADDRWSVTTEITLEVGSGLQSPGTRLSAEAGIAHVDDVGGLAVGRVHSRGVPFCLAEMAATLALSARPGPALTTASVHLAYLRPVPDRMQLAMSARVLHRGRTLGVVDVTGDIAGRTAIAARVVANPAP